MKWFAIAFAMLLVTIVILADRNSLPPLLRLIKELPFGDKVGHFMLMGMMSFLTNLALKAKELQLGKFRILQGTLLVIIPVTLEEMSQVFFPSRTLDLMDLTADYLGIFGFGQLAAFLLSQQRSKSVQSGSKVNS
jgi:VanZ family protein